MRAHQFLRICGLLCTVLLMSAPDLGAQDKRTLQYYVSNDLGMALEQIGWNSAVGKEFSIMGEERAGTVFGVVEDFHFRSLHHEFAPCAMLLR